MSAPTENPHKALRRLMNLVVFLSLLVPTGARAQTWVWSTETIAPEGKQASLAVDKDGNLHLSFVDGRGVVNYGFRPEGSSRWYTMPLEGTRSHSDTFTKIALDQQGNPHICFTPGILRYAYLDGRKWHFQQVSPDSGEIAYSCAVAIASDGTPHLAWYQYGNPDGTTYLHIRHAVLKDGLWLARTIDFSTQTGKHHSMVLDAQGNPQLTYDAFVDGELRYARWNGTEWSVTTVDSRALNKAGAYNRGMGSDLALSQDGTPQISYVDDNSLRFARLQGSRWVLEIVDGISPTGSWLGWRSCLVLDSRGLPHISYEDNGILKHAHRNGMQWHIQILVPTGPERHRYHSMVMGKDGRLYVAYRDPLDRSLKLTVGQLTTEPERAATEKQARK